MNLHLLIVHRGLLRVASPRVVWQSIAPCLDDRLLDIDSSVVDLGDGVIPHQIVSDVLFFEADKTEATTRPGVDIFQDNGVDHFTELVEVLFELLVRQLEIKAPNEDFRLGVRKLDSLFVINDRVETLLTLTIFGLTDHVRIRLLNLLATSRCDRLVTLVGLQAVLARRSFLIVVRRLYINALLKDEVPRVAILVQYSRLHLNGCDFILEAH